MSRPNWFNENEGRTFPLIQNFQENLEISESTSLIDAGIFSISQLPNSAVVDFGSTMGPLSFYEEGTHVVYLFEVRREDPNYVFEFRSTAPGLVGYSLVFTRSITSTDFAVEYSEATNSPLTSVSPNCPEVAHWSGYMVNGDLLSLAATLTTDGQKLFGGFDEAVIEPALNRNLVDSFVNSINLANSDRTRATNPVTCIGVSWPFSLEPIYVMQNCLSGSIRWKEGFNCIITQNDSDNSITIAAFVGGGAGAPCDEIPVFTGEVPPTDGTVLTGGPSCNEVIRTINGIGGRVLDLFSGDGVTITSEPDSNLIILDVDTKNLAVCFDGVNPEESFCPEESVTVTLCGPV